MKRQFVTVGLTMLTTLSLFFTIFAVPPSAANDGATQFSGVGYYAAPGECTDADGDGSDLALNLTGDLAGCLYSFVETSRCTVAGTYYESGNEIYIGLYNGAPGSFRTTYVFTGKYADCSTFSGELHGGCRHPVVRGSGTGIFEGATGRVDFRDDVEAGTFPYRGHFRWNGPAGADAAIQNTSSVEYTVDSILLPQSGSLFQKCS